MARNTLSLLKQFGKQWYSLSDLEKIFGLGRESLRVALTRLTRSGAIRRIGRGLYVLPDQPINPERIATMLYTPSYISFESALARYGIVSQIPYTVTVATKKKPKKMTLAGQLVEFRQLKEPLFFGYTLVEGVYLAYPEKALLDQLYLMSKGRASLAIDELDLGDIDWSRFMEFAAHFPFSVQQLARKVVKQYSQCWQEGT